MRNQLHIVENASIASGGEGLAAMRYAESIAQAGCAVVLLSKHVSCGYVSKPLGKGRFAQQAAPVRHNLLHAFFSQYRYIHKLCVEVKFDLVHLHGMWSPFLMVAALVARMRNIPIVITPHGCLEPWALAFKRRKKWIALRSYQGAILRSASLFVATSHQEMLSIRGLGLRQAVAVIPNGVDIGTHSSHRSHDGPKTILFLSRVHPIKGLLDLVEAWAHVRQKGWRIVIAGGDEGGHRAKVEGLINEKGLQSDFEFLGFVEGERKQACFDAADIFILPTYSENFGIAVAEALANELPVITTTGAPWQDLVGHRCGWWAEPSVQGISGALVAAMACDSAELQEMGKRGRQLVIEKYSWNGIGSSALEVSEWLLDESRPKPDCIYKYGH